MRSGLCRIVAATMFGGMMLGGISPALAQEAGPGITLSLDTAQPADIHPVHYACGDAGAVDVTYINADPNYLAVVTLDGVAHVFVSALSGSGARYTAGFYEWWVKGDEATLRDLREDENAAPLRLCTQAASSE